MLKVCKFGGSSVANAKQFKKIKGIVESEKERKIIVASACGKEGKDDHKVTDLLYLCLAHKKYGMSYDDILAVIEAKHQSIIDELKIEFDIKKEIEALRELLETKADADYVVSRGEYLSSRLLALYLNADFVDAKDVISFNYDGSLNIEKTKEKFLPYLDTKNKVVVPGFYGTLPNGVIKTMSRGGSDITGSLLANIVDADVYENWTDVSGIYVCDPRIIKDPKRISTITYSELREMSYMGANVLHDESIFPVKEKNIPINIRNTNKPEDKGTMIVSSVDDQVKSYPITGITGKKDFAAITVAKSNSSSEIGFLKKTLEVFENYKVPVVLVTTSIDAFSIIIDKKDVKNTIYELANDIKVGCNCEEVHVTDNLSLVCVVGRGMKARKGFSGQVFSLLGENGINVRTISQGADELSIIVGIEDRDFTKTISSIYERFID
ncbi:MAG: aspartate kinase [Erysipelotrichaceae bacterium]|nr:aspartate kinase [Erysipelotrichaceae bacterium]